MGLRALGKQQLQPYGGNSTIFHSELGKTATPGALPFTDYGEIMYSTLFCVILFSVNFLSFAHDLSCYCK